MLLTIATLLVIKHFVCDFPLQAFPWMYRNKGDYGHPGGLAHAGVHWAGTFVALIWFCPWPVAFAAGYTDAMAHYHIDWAKMQIGQRMGWRPDNSEWFWILLGLDQMAHYLTYMAIIALVA